MWCYVTTKTVGLWIVENSENSIEEVSHTTGKALVAYSKKKASKIKIGRNIEIELVPG